MRPPRSLSKGVAARGIRMLRTSPSPLCVMRKGPVDVDASAAPRSSFCFVPRRGEGSRSVSGWVLVSLYIKPRLLKSSASLVIPS